MRRDKYPCAGLIYGSFELAAIAAEFGFYALDGEPTAYYQCSAQHWHWTTHSNLRRWERP